MSSRYNPVSAGVKAALLAQALGAEVHRFGAAPAQEPPAARPSGMERAVDPVRAANLVLPRKDARREILAAYVAQRDTLLKACIEDVLGQELTDPATQLEGHALQERLFQDEPYPPGMVRLLPRADWHLDGQPLLMAPPLFVRELGDESRGDWRAFQLLRNLPDELLLGIPERIYQRRL